MISSGSAINSVNASDIIGRFYIWLWFHTEFWLTPVDRRPYTFIMQDWIFNHAGAAAAMIGTWFAGMLALSFYHGTISTFLAIGSALVTAHLVWGVKWIEGQQEFPPVPDA